MRARTHTTEIEVERDGVTVSYEVEFTICPPERGSPRTMDDPGTPDYPASVEDVTVFWVHKDRLTGKKIREERPELEALVSEEELLETADADERDAYEAHCEDEADRRRDDRLCGEGR